MTRHNTTRNQLFSNILRFQDMTATVTRTTTTAMGIRTEVRVTDTRTEVREAHKSWREEVNNFEVFLSETCSLYGFWKEEHF